MQQYTLLTDADSTGEAVNPLPGTYKLYIYGTWDGATATLQSRQVGSSSWVNEPAGSFAADSTVFLEVLSGLSGDVEYRFSIASAGGSTELSAELV